MTCYLPRCMSLNLMWWTAPAPGIEVPLGDVVRRITEGSRPPTRRRAKAAVKRISPSLLMSEITKVLPVA
jgi:hypothetical protein